MNNSDQMRLSGICDSILDAVGLTPVVRLGRIFPPENACEIVAKLEFMNPSGSIKDRMVKYMLTHAEENGLLATKHIVESSSGNTGASLAMICAIRGFRCDIAVPDKISKEKLKRISAFGARVRVCPSDLPSDDERNYYTVARQLAEEEDAFYLDQYHSKLNRQAHYLSTGPELWAQLNGHIDYLVCGVGSGGTISGIGRFLKEQNPEIKVIGVEPIGSGYRRSIGRLATEMRPTSIEGIGKPTPVDAFDPSVVDDVIQVSDSDSLEYCQRLAKEEGIMAGGSSGSVLAGIAQLRSSICNGRVATILPDSGAFYLSKYFDSR